MTTATATATRIEVKARGQVGNTTCKVVISYTCARNNRSIREKALPQKEEYSRNACQKKHCRTDREASNITNY